MRVYLEVARKAYARQSTYRMATFAGVFTNTVFGFLRAYVMLAVFAARPNINGFSAADAVTFTFVTQGLLVPMGIMGPPGEQSERIRTGDVVVDLHRPVDYHAYWTAVEAGRSAFFVVFRGIPPFLAGWLLLDDVNLPPVWWLWPAFFASVALAAGITGAFRFIVQCLGFWLLDVRGPYQILMLLVAFFSGMLVPTFLFPAALATLGHALPFESMLQRPAEVFLGAHTGWDLAAVLAVQFGWLLALVTGARIVQARATRKVVIQGG